MTTYAVSGFMRSGTSMMMDALTSGGLNPAFNPSRDKLNEKYGDDHYRPNPNGFYELSREEYTIPGFPEKYQGMLIKCLWGGIIRFAAGEYKVVFMLRDPEEIRQSYEAFFNCAPPKALSDYDANMNATLGILGVRSDMDVTTLFYRDVISSPIDAFVSLQKKGWPIDPEKAASVIDPNLLRFKIEELTRGA